jgi:geranylgeranyl diphosphate synthase, type II
MNLNEYINKNLSFINDSIKNSIENSVSKDIKEAMLYSLNAGGKRFRSILSMISYDTFCDTKDYNKIKPLFLALEMIHTYSLIHDDLPCMDDDDLRRGKPTNHKVYGEDIATLAGDGLLTYSFSLLCKLSKSFDSKNVLNLISYISCASGINGMLGGQVLDIKNSKNKNIDLEYLKKTSLNKTGALIRASLVGPLILLNIEDNIIKRFEKFGDLIGLSFQVVDDILGVSSSKEKLGKSINIDVRNDKLTFVDLFGLKESKIFAKELIENSKKEIKDFDKTGLLSDLADYVVKRSK